MLIVVRSFGDDTTCHSIEELEKVLFEKYLKRSVAIHIKNNDSDIQITFVDIMDDLTLIGTYSKRKISLKELFIN